jgi:surfeit locus 1 family protein
VESGSEWVLVNRGWVPLGESRAQLPAVTGPAERITLRAMIKLPPGKAFGPEAAEDSGSGWPQVIQQLEIGPIGKRLGRPLLPLVLQLDKADPGGFVRDWKPVYGITPDKHRAYAAQWFTLALVLLLIYIGVNTHRRT